MVKGRKAKRANFVSSLFYKGLLSIQGRGDLMTLLSFMGFSSIQSHLTLSFNICILESTSKKQGVRPRTKF
jgi:hypothetical protein